MCGMCVYQVYPTAPRSLVLLFEVPLSDRRHIFPVGSEQRCEGRAGLVLEPDRRGVWWVVTGETLLLGVAEAGLVRRKTTTYGLACSTLNIAGQHFLGHVSTRSR